MKLFRKSKNSRLEIPPAIKRDVFIIFIFLLSLFSLASLFNLTGKAGQFLDQLWQWIFGWGWWVWPFLLLIIGYLMINKERLQIRFFRWLGLFLFVLAYSGLLHFLVGSENLADAAKEGTGGGYLGFLLTAPLIKITGFWGALLILIFLLLLSLLFFFEKTLAELKDAFSRPSLTLFNNFKGKIKDATNDVEPEEIDEAIGFEQKEIVDADFSEKKSGPSASVPATFSAVTGNELFPETKHHYARIDLPLELLNDKSTVPNSGDIKSNQEVIRRTLQYFGIEVEMGEVSVGPTVTQYTFKPASGVKVAQITTLSNDLALALAAHPIRIEAPIPGKSLVGIEVPNQKIALVGLKDIIKSPEFKNRKSNLTFVLGKDVAGQPWVYDLGKMPHLLLAGATGTGKTVCLNSIIISLLYGNQPDELKFIMVDPKRVELPSYNNIPHLLSPVIVEVKKTIHALQWATREMDRRFQILSNENKRNIAAYNETYKNEKLPYIIIVIDELADLMATAANEVESSIVRLAQMARAVGIHLVLATQRPSVEVLTGLIKANITSRIAFTVGSLVDSRTILDCSGAEKLLGRGDMLFMTPELSKPKRLQGAFVSDDEIERVVAYLKEKGKPEFDASITEKQSGGDESFGGHGFENDDPLVEEAKGVVVKTGKASASYLQRRFSIGYSRAARILDLLEEKGVVGPANGSKPREILINKMDLVTDDYLAAHDVPTEEIIEGEENLNLADIPTTETPDEEPF
jgi:S-DNA-T family DNA segregation ATPase FtsK/SpoIIIE